MALVLPVAGRWRAITIGFAVVAGAIAYGLARQHAKTTSATVDPALITVTRQVADGATTTNYLDGNIHHVALLGQQPDVCQRVDVELVAPAPGGGRLVVVGTWAGRLSPTAGVGVFLLRISGLKATLRADVDAH